MDWEMKFSDEEKIVSEIYGVLGIKEGFASGWPAWSSESTLPSNALFFTNKRIFLMFIDKKLLKSITPLKYITRDKVQQRGDDLIATLSLEEILNMTPHPIAIAFDEIEEVKLRKWKEEGSRGDSFTIRTIDKKKYKYTFWNKTDIPKLEKTLKDLLFAKAVIESGKLIR